MKDLDRSSRMSFLETFKALSTFISTVLIALASIFVTTQYNKKQLEITQIKEISALIPKLGSQDKNERKFSAIALGLYGESAVPALIAVLGDDNSDVRNEGAKSIALIGEPAIPYLEKMFRDERNDSSQRATCLFTLGLMKAKVGLNLATRVLGNPQENPVIRKDAATTLGMFKDPHSTKILLGTLDQAKVNDPELTQNILWSLGQIADASTVDSIVSILSHPNAAVRRQAVWSLSQIKGENVSAKLAEVAAKDKSKEVKQAAAQAIEWQRRLP